MKFLYKTILCLTFFAKTLSAGTPLTTPDSDQVFKESSDPFFEAHLEWIRSNDPESLEFYDQLVDIPEDRIPDFIQALKKNHTFHSFSLYLEDLGPYFAQFLRALGHNPNLKELRLCIRCEQDAQSLAQFLTKHRHFQTLMLDFEEGQIPQASFQAILKAIQKQTHLNRFVLFTDTFSLDQEALTTLYQTLTVLKTLKCVQINGFFQDCMPLMHNCRLLIEGSAHTPKDSKNGSIQQVQISIQNLIPFIKSPPDLFPDSNPCAPFPTAPFQNTTPLGELGPNLIPPHAASEKLTAQSTCMVL